MGNIPGDTAGLPARRRIEAEFARALLPALQKSLGRDQALAILAGAIQAEAERQGRALRKDLGPGLEGIAKVWEGLGAGGALDLEILESSTRRLHFRVTRCAYAEMYRDLGLTELGPILSCARDAAFLRGFDERITLDRPTTLLEGGTCCELAYVLRDGEGP